jgi:hypothetical protein
MKLLGKTMKKYISKVKDYYHEHQKRFEYIFLAFIFCFSLFIRRIGIKHGFPLLTHPDEPVSIDPILRMTRLHTLNPDHFSWPSQIQYYLNFFYLNIVSFILYGKNVYWAYEENYLTFYFHARLLISIMGSLIPIVAHKIGKEFKLGFSFFAALVFALFPLYIEHSLYVTPDIPITLFTMLVMFFTLRYINTNAQHNLYIATVFSSINTAEKYPGLLSLAIVIVGIGIQLLKSKDVILKQKIKQFLLKFSIVFLIYFVFLFIFGPYLFIEYKKVIQAIIGEARSTHLGADGLGWLGNLGFYLRVFYSYSNIIGITFFCIGLIAAINQIFKKNEMKFLLLFYGFVYWIALSKLGLHWERWALPMYISPLLIISLGLAVVWKRRRVNKIFKITIILILSVFFVCQLLFSLSVPMRMKYKDTRYASLIYCEQNNINKNNTIYEGYTPLFPGHPILIFDEYQSNKDNYEYVILSSSMFGRYYAEPERYQHEVSIYERIRDENELIKKFIPESAPESIIDRLEIIAYYIKNRLGLTDEHRFIGPTIEIYEISN